jgi:AraC-like DNA-binding protein
MQGATGRSSSGPYRFESNLVWIQRPRHASVKAVKLSSKSDKEMLTPLRKLDSMAAMSDIKIHRNETIHPAYARLLYLLLKQGAADADAVLASAGLNWHQLSTAPDHLEFTVFGRMVEAAQRRLDCPWLGLMVGSSVQVSAHGDVGHAALTGASLRQALQVIGQYGPLRADLFKYQFMQHEAFGVLSVGMGVAEPSAVRIFMYEAFFAALIKLCEAAVGPIAQRLEIDLPFATPTWANKYASFGVGKLSFGANQLVVRVPNDVLNLACITADANSFELMQRECARTMSEAETKPCTKHVYELLQKSSHSPKGRIDIPALNSVAAQLHMSARTLTRKLKAEGSNYQRLLDMMRMDRANWYLLHTQETVESIANLLGYEDASNFSRTFRRWFGKAPRDYRASFKK